MIKFIVLALAFVAVAQAGLISPLIRTSSIVAPLSVAVPAEDTGKWDGCHWDGRPIDCTTYYRRYAPKGLPIVTSAAVLPSYYSAAHYPYAPIYAGAPLGSSNIIIN